MKKFKSILLLCFLSMPLLLRSQFTCGMPLPVKTKLDHANAKNSTCLCNGLQNALYVSNVTCNTTSTQVPCDHVSYMKESYGTIRLPLKFHYSDNLPNFNSSMIDDLLDGVNQIFADNGVKLAFFDVGQKINTDIDLCVYEGTAPCSCNNSLTNLNIYALSNPQYISIGVFDQWINTECETESFGGQATFPGVTSPYATNFIVIDSKYFVDNSPYILAHELGHILGLYHTWENDVFGSNADVCGGDGITDSAVDTSSEHEEGTGNVMDYNLPSIPISECSFTACQRTKMYDVLFYCCNRESLGEDNLPAPILTLDENCNQSTVVANNGINNPKDLNEGCHKIYADLGSQGSNTGGYVRWELYNVSSNSGNLCSVQSSDCYNNFHEFNTADLSVGDIYKIKAYDLPPYNNTNYSITGIPVEFYFVNNGTSNPCNLYFETFEVNHIDSDGDNIKDAVEFYCNGVSGTEYNLINGTDVYTELEVGNWYGNIHVGSSYEVCIEESNSSTCNTTTCLASNAYNGTTSCNDLSNFSADVNGSDVTYDWSWPSGSYSIEIEESWDGNSVFNSHIVNVTQPTSLTVNHTICNSFYARARIFCGTGYSAYTNWVYVNLDIGNNSCSNSNNPNAPTLQAMDIHFKNVTYNSLNANWTRGNGDKILVTCTPCGQNISQPQNGVDYSYNSDYSSAPSIGNSRVVYEGTSKSRTITGLSPSTCYIFSAYEFEGSSNNTLYQLVSAPQNSVNTLGAFSLDFTWDPMHIVEDEPIDFDWISSLGLSIEQWTFQGGTPSTNNTNGDNIYFYTPGIYTVTLEGYHGSYDQWETVTKQIEVLSASAFEPDFTFTYGDLNPTETSANDNVFVNWSLVNQGVDLCKAIKSK